VEIETLYTNQPNLKEFCSVTPGASCAIQIDEFSGGAVLRPTSPGFRGWSECPTAATGSTCFVPAGTAGSACAAFTWTTSDPVVGSCPPPYIQFYKKGDGKGTVTATQIDPTTGTPTGLTESCTSICPAAVWTRFAPESTVRLTATAEQGVFVRWERGCAAVSGNTCTVNLTATATVCAVFVAATPESDLNCPRQTQPKPPPPPPPPPTPNTRITSGPSATRATRSRRATFRFASTVARSTFQCRLDAKPWASCRSPKTYVGLKPGVHTFRVRATSSQGKRDATPAIRRWRIVR
jgi:hypothetical protein